jgi:hypothetical protein
VFLGLNPGGDSITHEEQRESCENGSPYVNEIWKNYPPGQEPLQKQIQILFAGQGWEYDQVLSGQLVPFRSQNWSSLPRKEESLEFGTSLWAEIFSYVRPNLVVALGKTEARAPINNLLSNVFGNVIRSKEISVGWGKICGGLDIYDHCRFISLPHLSRFRIMGRPASREGLKQLFSV